MFLFTPKVAAAKIDFEALQKYDKATFAGGCFWCLQPPLDQLKGVKATVVGYTGGTKENPTGEEVYLGKTGHFEAIQVFYDHQEVSYETLLDTFWRQIDPTDAGGQFADRGRSYMTAIFYHTDEQKKQAEASKVALENEHRFPGEIVTQILPAAAFYPAEEYHQNYYKKEPEHYYYYSEGSGRKDFIRKNWEEKK